MPYSTRPKSQKFQERSRNNFLYLLARLCVALEQPGNNSGNKGLFKGKQRAMPYRIKRRFGQQNHCIVGQQNSLKLCSIESQGKYGSPENTRFQGFPLADRVGFEPTCPCGQPHFECGSLRPLRYLSILNCCWEFGRYHMISSQSRYDHFDTAPYLVDLRGGKVPHRKEASL